MGPELPAQVTGAGTEGETALASPLCCRPDRRKGLRVLPPLLAAPLRAAQIHLVPTMSINRESCGQVHSTAAEPLCCKSWLDFSAFCSLTPPHTTLLPPLLSRQLLPLCNPRAEFQRAQDRMMRHSQEGAILNPCPHSQLWMLWKISLTLGC